MICLFEILTFLQALRLTEEGKYLIAKKKNIAVYWAANPIILTLDKNGVWKA